MKKRIVVFGRTGAGKSTLGNKIFGSSAFKVGHSLRSETLQCEEKILDWPVPENSIQKVSWIDTPGFADNRPDISNQIIVRNIMDLLKTLQEGLNLALFCLPAKTRVSADDIEEIEMIGKLLGKSVFDKMIIVITQLDTFNQETRRKFEETIPIELPPLLNTHDIPISGKQIIFSNFLDFEDKFLRNLDAKLRDSQNYQPKNTLQFNNNNQNYLESKEMLDILSAYRENFQKMEQQMLSDLTQLKNDGADLFQDEIEEKERELKKMQDKIKDFNRTISGKASRKIDSDSTLIRLLKSKNLIESPIDPLQITVIENGQKKVRERPHDPKDHDESARDVDSFAWRIMVPHYCAGFEYSFRECSHSKNCLILVIRQKNYRQHEDFKRSNVFDLERFCTGNSKFDRELLCEISGIEKSFKVSNIKSCSTNCSNCVKIIRI